MRKRSPRFAKKGRSYPWPIPGESNSDDDCFPAENGHMHAAISWPLPRRRRMSFLHLHAPPSIRMRLSSLRRLLSALKRDLRSRSRSRPLAIPALSDICAMPKSETALAQRLEAYRVSRRRDALAASQPTGCAGNGRCRARETR